MLGLKYGHYQANYANIKEKVAAAWLWDFEIFENNVVWYSDHKSVCVLSNREHFIVTIKLCALF